MPSDHKLSPIPHSPDEGSECGAAVNDILLHRPDFSTPEKSFFKRPSAEIPGYVPQTRKLEALVTPLSPRVPRRSSSKPCSKPPGPIEIPDRAADQDQMEFRERSSSRQGHQRNMRSLPQSPLTADSRLGSRPDSGADSEISSYRTVAISLPPLQHKGLDEHDQLEPLDEENLDPESFDLVAPAEKVIKQYSLETRSELLFSTEHLKEIFRDPDFLLQFMGFMNTYRQASCSILIYYMDAVKALKAINYSNAIAESLEPISGFDFTVTSVTKTDNTELEEKARLAFDALVREDLPAYITHSYIQTVSLSIQRRITGTLPSHLREASEGLAEVFCLTDPSRPDNPIVFASEEFHRTTQYGMSYVLGRNCRFLQGPKTNPFSVRRIREKIEAGQEHCEVILNYRRDGSPFMNLLMCAPLCDSRGTIRYFIGAQVDVSGLVKECSGMDSLRCLANKSEPSETPENGKVREEELPRDELQDLSQMFNLEELDTVRRWGGRMRKENQDEAKYGNYIDGNWSKPRVLISSGSPDANTEYGGLSHGAGRLSGIYENYLLVRPCPSLRILFASPSLRIPGILQSPFMAKIRGSNRVREGLIQALADGRGVTAKVKWASKTDLEGRNRWIHCTPLIGSNGAIGVWMVVIVDDEASVLPSRRFKMAPPVDPKFGQSIPTYQQNEAGSLHDCALINGDRDASVKGGRSSTGSHDEMDGSGSPYSLRIE